MPITLALNPFVTVLGPAWQAAFEAIHAEWGRRVVG